MNLAAVMDQIGDALDTIAGLNIHRYPADAISPPAALVGYPETINFDETYQRGADTMVLPVLVVVAPKPARAARTRLAAYCDGTGAKSVKQVIESYSSYTALGSVRVQTADFDVVTIAGTDYPAALFTLDIAGGGN